MADFGYFQAQANQRGLVLCMICFNEKPRDQMEPVERQYFCPTSGQTEDPRFGGFDVCCDAPEKHVPNKVWDICKACQQIEDQIAAMPEQERRKLAYENRNGVIEGSGRPVEPKDFSP